MTTISRVKSPEDIFEHAAMLIQRAVKLLLSTQQTVVLALPGGRSMPGILARLVKKKIRWQRVHIFMVDERLVPIGDAESNFRLIECNLTKQLIRKSLLPMENVHPFVYDKDKAGYGIDDYQKELERYSDRYDIILVSSGEDGHIGGLYPDHHSIKDDADYFIAMEDSPKPPAHRMSMSRKLVLKSQIAIAIFMGSAKREALYNFNSIRYNFINCPVKLIQDIRNSYLITDIEADKK